MDKHQSTTRVSLAAALRHVLAQLAKLLEHEDPQPLLQADQPFELALRGWRRAVEAQTGTATVQRTRELEHAKLELMGRVAQKQKERDDLQERNKELLDQLVKQKKHEETIKQRLLEAQFSGGGLKAEAKQLDLEIRELRRRVRELEGGPPLTPAEAAPTSKSAPVAAEPEATDTDSAPMATQGAISDPGAVAATPPPVAIALSERRAAAEQAFRDLWKPKATEVPSEAPAAPAAPLPKVEVAGVAAKAAGAIEAPRAVASTSGRRASAPALGDGIETPRVASPMVQPQPVQPQPGVQPRAKPRGSAGAQPVSALPAARAAQKAPASRPRTSPTPKPLPRGRVALKPEAAKALAAGPQRAQLAAKPVAAKPAAKPVAKPVAAKPAAKKPLAKPAAKKPLAKPAVGKPLAKPVAKPVGKPLAKPLGKPVVAPRTGAQASAAERSKQKTKGGRGVRSPR
ncbi:MAG: hypothetical protein IPG96_04135 [Proteobacteria bacterium]|nr:hypothetical protein [Pseudomonadota bacterium]